MEKYNTLKRLKGNSEKLGNFAKNRKPDVKHKNTSGFFLFRNFLFFLTYNKRWQQYLYNEA